MMFVSAVLIYACYKTHPRSIWHSYGILGTSSAGIPKDAAMAATAFHTALQAEPIRGRLKTVLAALRQTLDAFVSYRIRLAATKAGHIRPLKLKNTSSSSTPV